MIQSLLAPPADCQCTSKREGSFADRGALTRPQLLIGAGVTVGLASRLPQEVCQALTCPLPPPCANGQKDLPDCSGP